MAVFGLVVSAMAFVWRQLTEVGEVKEVPVSRVTVEWKPNYWVMGLYVLLGGIITILLW